MFYSLGNEKTAYIFVGGRGERVYIICVNEGVHVVQIFKSKVTYYLNPRPMDFIGQTYFCNTFQRNKNKLINILTCLLSINLTNLCLNFCLNAETISLNQMYNHLVMLCYIFKWQIDQTEYRHIGCNRPGRLRHASSNTYDCQQDLVVFRKGS